MMTVDTTGLWHRELFLPACEAKDKEQLLQGLVEVLCRHAPVHHRDALTQSLLERERVGTTALGHAVAVPHSRSMVVDRTTVLFARLVKGVSFAAPDGVPVRLVFLLTAPYGSAGHLYAPALSAIATAARIEAARQRLLQVATFEEFLVAIHAFVAGKISEAITI